MILHYKQERSGPPTTPANNPEPVPVRGFTIGECMNFYRNVVSHTLGNGMRIFVLPRPGSPVEVECFVKTGSIHEGDSLGSGLSHFLEHMLFQGCRNYPGTAAADTIDRLGGSINAYTSFDHTAYHAHLAGIHLETAIDVLAAMVRHPEFPAERFAAEREVILREQELGADNPDRKLFETLNAEVFKLHPVRCPIIGFRHLIAGVTRDRVAEYWRRRYTPGRIFWVVVGNADPGRVCDAIGERLEDWQDLFPGEPALPVEPEQCIERHTEFCFSDPLARLAAGIRTPAITHRAIPALDVLAGILGMGESSRLVRLLEREKQLAVDLRTFCYAQPFGGILGITAAASPGKLGRLESALRRELEAIRAGGITAAEAKREKRQQLAEHLRQLRTLHEIAANIGGGVVACDSPDLSDGYLEKLEALTVDEIRQAAAEYLAPEHFSFVRQRPAGKGSQRNTAAKPRRLTPVSETLPDGVRLVTITDRELPLVDFALSLPGGTIFESAGTGGISALAADLLTAGTRRRTENDLLNRLDSCGATLNINTGLNSFILELNAPRRQFPAALRLVREILCEPAFGEPKFERERDNRLELMRSRAQAPRAAAQDLARQLLFGAHPYSWGTNGTPEQLRHLTREAIAEFYRSFWRPGQVICGFGGDCSETEAAEWGKMVLDGIAWLPGSQRLPAPPEFPKESTMREIRLDRNQTALVRAIPGPALVDGTYNCFKIFHHAENGLSSRLFKLIREENALAYTTGMRLSGGFHPGWLLFHAVTAPEQARRAEQLIAGEIARLAEEGIPAEEFDAARECAAFAAAQTVESVSSALSAVLLAMHYSQEPESVWNNEAELRQLTRDEVNRVIAPFLAASAAVTVFAGKAIQA